MPAPADTLPHGSEEKKKYKNKSPFSPQSFDTYTFPYLLTPINVNKAVSHFKAVKAEFIHATPPREALGKLLS